jgi:hypothetical protein
MKDEDEITAKLEAFKQFDEVEKIGDQRAVVKTDNRKDNHSIEVTYTTRTGQYKETFNPENDNFINKIEDWYESL